MKSLKESLFDKDLINKYPVDLSFLKTSKPQEKADIFMTIQQLMTDPFYIHMEKWMENLFQKYESGFNHLQQTLVELFKKQGFYSWFNITEDDFETMGDEMTDEEIERKNTELEDFFKRAYQTESRGFFLISKDKIPEFILDIIKCTDHWNKGLEKCKEWAVCYWPDFGPVISFYGCPNGLDPTIKKLLYN